MREMAVIAIKSGLLPKSVRTPEQAMLIALRGRELGVPSVASWGAIHVIEGVTSLSANLMYALALRDRVIRIDPVEETDTSITLRGTRLDFDPPVVFVYTYTNDDAKRAGLLLKNNWQKYGRDMRYARCVSGLIKRLCPDVTTGMYNPDELGIPSKVTADGDVIADPSWDGMKREEFTDVEFTPEAATPDPEVELAQAAGAPVGSSGRLGGPTEADFSPKEWELLKQAQKASQIAGPTFREWAINEGINTKAPRVKDLTPLLGFLYREGHDAGKQAVAVIIGNIADDERHPAREAAEALLEALSGGVVDPFDEEEPGPVLGPGGQVLAASGQVL